MCRVMVRTIITGLQACSVWHSRCSTWPRPWTEWQSRRSNQQSQRLAWHKRRSVRPLRLSEVTAAAFACAVATFHQPGTTVTRTVTVFFLAFVTGKVNVTKWRSDARDAPSAMNHRVCARPACHQSLPAIKFEAHRGRVTGMHFVTIKTRVTDYCHVAASDPYRRHVL